MKHRKQMLLIIFFITIFLLLRNNVYGQINTSINATVQISICGNGIAEGGEDCDGADLRRKTCASLGFSYGTLSCDISCSYDTSSCIATSFTPTPSQTISSFLTSPVNAAQNVAFLTPTSLPIQTSLPGQQSILPSTLRQFDLNGDGKIDVSELHTVLSIWVSDWEKYLKLGNQDQNKKCDLNQNGTCGLHDFSILLFYVGK